VYSGEHSMCSSGVSGGGMTAMTEPDALDPPRYFILLPSPEAALSHWVDQELAHWRGSPRKAGASPPSQRVLIALTEGQLVRDASLGAGGDSDRPRFAHQTVRSLSGTASR
jgi:hypothetical protein